MNKMNFFKLLLCLSMLLVLIGCGTLGIEPLIEEQNTSEVSTIKTEINTTESKESVVDTEVKAEKSESNEIASVTNNSKLNGEWLQTNGQGSMIHIALIENNIIEIYWLNLDTSNLALYWAGSIPVIETLDKPIIWESINDKNKTSKALLASPDDTKTFTFDNGIISYKASALGMTNIIELQNINNL